jgi:hypothetical protein
MTSPSLASLVINDQLLRSMPNIALALFLLHERSQSKWKPYIDVLPNHFTTPLYFDYDQLNRLKASAALCKNHFFIVIYFLNESLFRRCFNTYNTNS